MTAISKAAIPPDLFDRAALALIEQQEPDVQAHLRESYEHRAAVAEYHGGLIRTEAERLAFRELRQTLGLLK